MGCLFCLFGSQDIGQYGIDSIRECANNTRHFQQSISGLAAIVSESAKRVEERLRRFALPVLSEIGAAVESIRRHLTGMIGSIGVVCTGLRKQRGDFGKLLGHFSHWCT